MTYNKLTKTFFARDTHSVAKELLGKLLVRRLNKQVLIGRITEVESYVGKNDLACHASKGRTARCEVMFGEAGHAYVYLIYGMYNCLNIVTDKKDFPAAVLIRSLEPLLGLQKMKKLRKTGKENNLTTGPGKLTQAFDITRAFNNKNIINNRKLFLANDNYKVTPDNIISTARIGVDYAGEYARLPWRYYLKNSKFISKK